MPDATAAALLTTQAHALSLLHHVVALHGGRPRAAAPMLVDTVEQIRKLARRQGARAMAAEVRRSLPVLPSPDDRAHAERAVAGYLKALDIADEKKAAGQRVSVPGVVAGKLDLIAATEVPSAFGDERDRLETRIVRDNPTLAPLLFKTWNARLDACPRCHALDGQRRLWGFAFEGGQVPGDVHPRCACFTTYMPIPVVLPGRQRQQATWMEE